MLGPSASEFSRPPAKHWPHLIWKHPLTRSSFPQGGGSGYARGGRALGVADDLSSPFRIGFFPDSQHLFPRENVIKFSQHSSFNAAFASTRDTKALMAQTLDISGTIDPGQ